ncbi:Hypothetical_protein [Hexamita inflata]|uniref:Hypothetical_protein n=1 Tax=Hexamita inflata TaxID=28002 RepID=A0AA86TPF9_9EUKA|nr:Hypothetical protein HINF_LOCUS6348 [Hexamita inflata]
MIGQCEQKKFKEIVYTVGCCGTQIRNDIANKLFGFHYAQDVQNENSPSEFYDLVLLAQQTSKIQYTAMAKEYRPSSAQLKLIGFSSRSLQYMMTINKVVQYAFISIYITAPFLQNVVNPFIATKFGI